MQNAIVLLCLLLAGCAAPSAIPAPVATRNALRVVDINVWSGLDYQGYVTMGEYETPAVREKRYQALLAQLKDLDPDIIGVHEANKLPGYIRRLAGDLGYDAVFHVGIGGLRAGPVGLPWNLREGDAILAKRDLGLVPAGRRQLSGGPVGSFFTCHFEDATQVVAARISLETTPVFLFSTHWHASVLDTPNMRAKAEALAKTAGELEAAMEAVDKGKQWRMDEARKTLAFIREVAGDAPVILMGDFNATEETGEIRALLDHGLVDTFGHTNPDGKGATWDSRANRNIIHHYLEPGMPASGGLVEKLNWIQESIPQRIDYIFAGPSKVLNAKGMSVKSSRVVLNKTVDGVHASDHFGVLSEIVFR
ncbi:MAG: endonuclease/exonuclease/phosphatase family protein [Desulfobacterales bacterium]|nr:endonuclease/exonuclease/phosphatase family protein [Desulfobacterales bacterium]